MTKKIKPTILIDLDGVLNNYKGHYDKNIIPEINKNAIIFLKKLYTLNKYTLVLFTTRNLLLSAKWLIENKIDKYFYDITNTKIPAMLHIDDRAVCFKGDYGETISEIEKFRVWWRD